MTVYDPFVKEVYPSMSVDPRFIYALPNSKDIASRAGLNPYCMTYAIAIDHQHFTKTFVEGVGKPFAQTGAVDNGRDALFRYLTFNRPFDDRQNQRIAITGHELLHAFFPSSFALNNFERKRLNIKDGTRAVIPVAIEVYARTWQGADKQIRSIMNRVYLLLRALDRYALVTPVSTPTPATLPNYLQWNYDCIDLMYNE
ncbi:hypothetical protein ValSw41_33 [Vibrio phage ValSw4_1]|nr:hypothetical protein ValSw41_33 [Vibrio phage ValSw4_1]